VKVTGRQICWGVRYEWVHAPIANLPPGAVEVRRRLRPKDVGKVFVKHNDVLTMHYLMPNGESSSLLISEPVAMNKRRRC